MRTNRFHFRSLLHPRRFRRGRIRPRRRFARGVRSR